MKAYVINLKDQPERWKRITAVLKSLKIPYERQEGVIVASNELPYCWVFNRDLYRGELGCLLAHIEIWKRISQGTDPFGLVLEDDAVLSPKLPLFLNKIEKYEPFFDVLKLDGTYKGDSFLTLDNSLKHIEDFLVGKLLSSAMGATSYILSRSSAKKLLNLSKNVWLPVDELLYNKYSPLYSIISVYQIQQILSWQLVHYEDKKIKFSKKFDSTINPMRKKRDQIINPFSACKKLFKKVLWIYKIFRLKNKIYLKEDHSEQFSKGLMEINLLPSMTQTQKEN